MPIHYNFFLITDIFYNWTSIDIYIRYLQGPLKSILLSRSLIYTLIYCTVKWGQISTLTNTKGVSAPPQTSGENTILIERGNGRDSNPPLDRLTPYCVFKMLFAWKNCPKFTINLSKYLYKFWCIYSVDIWRNSLNQQMSWQL